MKNCICCLSILLLTGLVACTGSETSESSKQAQLTTIDPVTQLGLVTEVVTSTDKDSTLALEMAEKEKAARLLLAIESTRAVKEAYEGKESVTGNYVESIPFATFLGTPVESGALEIIPLEAESMRIYADYFDGEPIGGKLFFIHNNALVAIEVIQIKEQITEKGASIEEKSTHISYYHKDVLLSTVDLSVDETLEASTLTWLEEHLADWELIKRHINTL